MHLLKLAVLMPSLLLSTIFLIADVSVQDIYFENEDLYSNENEDFCEYDTNHSLHFRKANTITIGPEIYRVNRDRAGGTKQKGNSAGVRVKYDHIKRYNIYFGAQVFYGSGILRGHAGNGDRIRSRLTEKLVEGNIGYTFQAKCFPHASFTPFAGYGYFRDENKFSPPSNLQIQFTTQFRYLSLGFLSSMYVLPCITIGVNARFKWPWQTRCKVTNDPDFNTIHQIVADKLHYRIELPLTYFGSLCLDHYEFAFVPFFEQRLYGARENFPFDFFKTKFTLYGMNVQFIYRF